MPTDKQIAANRRNAQKSTGPRTLAGKIKSSLNALRHGLYSDIYILKTEDADTFRNFAAAYLQEFDPQTPSELELVDMLIHTAWRRRRIAALITARLNDSIEEVVSEPEPEPIPKEQTQSKEPTTAVSKTITLRAYARAERTDPTLTRFETHEIRLTALFLRTINRLYKLTKGRNEANLAPDLLGLAA